jgi:hypothetical protein
MSNIADLRNILSDNNETTQFIKSVFDEEITKYKLSPIEEKHYNSLFNMLNNLNIELINKHSESPIEKIFLLSVFITSITVNLTGFIYTAPVLDTDKYMDYYHSDIGFLVNDFKDFSRITGKGLKDYEEYLIETNKLNESQGSKLRTDLIMYIGFNFYNQYHVMIQPTFCNINRDSKKIRADLLIWKPSDKNVRLVIECDGYEYHQDKKHFIEDRKRDRDFNYNNYDIIRFSGTEIYNSFIDVSYELVNTVYTKYGKT